RSLRRVRVPRGREVDLARDARIGLCRGVMGRPPIYLPGAAVAGARGIAAGARSHPHGRGPPGRPLGGGLEAGLRWERVPARVDALLGRQLVAVASPTR